MSCRWVVLLALLAWSPLLSAQVASPSRARVTYLAGGLAYLDIGRDDGLREGQILEARRSGQVLATLTVTYLASHRAACRIVTGMDRLAVGDTVEYTRADPAPAPADSATPGKSGPRGRREGSLHGRVGLRYLRVTPPGGASFSQPALDLRVDGSRLGGTWLGLLVDLRARRTYRRLNDSTQTVDARNAVYQAALLLRSGGPARITLGRQYLPTVASVSLFDGALLEYQLARFGAGVFAGAEPDPASMGLGDARDYGFFVETRSAPGRPTRWSISGGAVGSYAEGEVNREFGFLQTSIAGPRVTFFASQEVDLNRGWKADAGEPSLTFTSTFASLSARPTDWISLHTGVDSRRNVRLYRDHETPEAVFDDSFRQGVFGGLSIAAGGHLRLGADVRAGFGADSLQTTRSQTGWLSLDRISAIRLTFRTRHTRYSSGGRAGWLQSVGLGVRPVSWIGIEGQGGTRREQQSGESTQASWLGADLDLSLARSFYFFVSLTRESGSLAAGDQLLGSLNWRF